MKRRSGFRMETYTNFFFTVWIRFFFLLTPFFVLSTFLAMTPELTPSERRGTAVRVTLAVLVSCFVL
jgi:multiple antibiotic resistance protein